MVCGSAMIAFGLIPPACYFAVRKSLTLAAWPIVRDALFYLIALAFVLWAIVNGSGLCGCVGKCTHHDLLASVRIPNNHLASTRMMPNPCCLLQAQCHLGSVMCYSGTTFATSASFLPRGTFLVIPASLPLISCPPLL